MKALSLNEIAKAVYGKLNRREYENLTITSVSTDSRKIAQGDLFVPIIGDRFDGHDFIFQAVESGAICVFSEMEIPSADFPVITVSGTRQALLDMAAYYRGLFKVKVVAITGSAGKTTTKDMITSVLKQKYITLKTEGNFNNDIGLPLTLFNLTEAHQIVVLEMGMNRAGEIYRLSETAKPDISIITNIGSAHMESMGSKEAILDAKCEIFAGMPESGRIFLNGDDKMLQTVRSDMLDITFFGINANNDYHAANIINNGMEGMSYLLRDKNGRELEIEISFPGEHMVMDSVVAAAVGIELGLDENQIKKGLTEFKPSSMRLDIQTNKNGVIVINDAYNANPESVRAALNILSEAKGRKICVLGDMLELGQASTDLHFEIGQYAAEKGIDLIICVGEASKYIYEGVYYEIDRGLTKSQAMYFMDKESILENINMLFEEGDTVLVKASRGMKFEDITRIILND